MASPTLYIIHGAMCVLDIKIFVGFVPLECADELCYMIVGVGHTTASGID